MNDFETALEKSLEWVALGATVEHCLEAYPQWANELKPMLEIAISMHQMEPKLSHSADMSIRRRLLQASKKEKMGVSFRLRHWLRQPVMENLMKNVKLTAALASNSKFGDLEAKGYPLSTDCPELSRERSSSLSETHPIPVISHKGKVAKVAKAHNRVESGQHCPKQRDPSSSRRGECRRRTRL